MRSNELRKVLVVLIVVICLMPMGVMATTFNVGDPGHGGVVDALDNALVSARSGDTINLVSDINSTLSSSTQTNATEFRKTVTISSNGYKINVNSTILFNGAAATNVIFVGNANFVYQPRNNAFTYNDSLIEIKGTSTTFSGSKVTVDSMDTFVKDPVNITGNTNTFNNRWDIINVTGTVIPGNPYAINLSGTGNTVTVSSGTFNATSRGINLVGTGNTLTFNSTNISTTVATGGVKVYLENSASTNIISDVNFVGNNLPNVYIYNATSVKPVHAWYFYNRTWSYDWMNMNVTINVSNSIPLAGNVGIVANWSNVTYPFNQNMVYRNTTNLGNSSGYTGGLSFNTTENIIFSGNFPAMVPVNISFGNNHFNTYTNEMNIGSVYILNFNPVNSTTPSTGKFNWTGTTNWTTIPDFTNALNVTFVVDSGSPKYTLYGNLSFLDPLDLTDPSTGTGLANLGNNLVMSANGNSIQLAGTATGMSALNKAAVLKVYPTNFVVTENSNNIQVTADGNQIYNRGSWNPQGYVSNTATLTVGNGNITLPVLHFTTYNFGGGVSSSSSSDEAVSGGSLPSVISATTVPTQTAVVATPTPGTPTTVGVNVGGSSVITKVAVTGTGINDVIVTALPHSDLIASITPPATTVYQYMTVSPARYTTISSATFNFDISTSWLASKGYTKNDIVMTVWDSDTKTWTPLPTSIISEKSGVITYQAITPHMSEFAVIYQKDAAAQAQANVTAIQTSVPLTTTMAIATTVSTTRPASPTPTKTVAPAPTAPPTGGLPTTTIVITVVAIIIIIAAAFLAHRWWVRKQNPALFKDLK